MASLSPSPSGRRLSELLEEKQEPFFLDLHLLEKGCSSRLLDVYGTTAMCWPAAGNDSASVLKRLTGKKKNEATRGSRGKKKQAAPAATGLLRILLSKILHGKAANRKPGALQFSESFKQVSPSPCSTNHPGAVEVAAADNDDEEMGYTNLDSDDEKQFSPVSVLDHPFESSPVQSQSKCSATQGSPNHAMAFVRDLLEAACSPALLTQLLAKSDDLIKSTAPWASDVFDDNGDCYYRTSTKNVLHDDEDDADASATATSAAAYWEAHRAELTRVSELVAAEVPNSSRLGAADVQPERQDVGADLEASVMDQLLQDLAVDLAGGCFCS
ncbi:hypothetical protein GUJ93_ZPchr0011g27091 [Zizania palustris]|uniref:Uncharacterized protein n=1 Tax=Zizania palustris TaxID=103762 RepID=A0A8J5WKP8_ZIZPA|nr:hypothetical protein GUJ93_ZPchr0011g27091 [Zizania palustris]